MKAREKEGPVIGERERAILLKYRANRLSDLEDEPTLRKYHVLGIIRLKYGRTAKEDGACLTLYGKGLLDLGE